MEQKMYQIIWFCYPPDNVVCVREVTESYIVKYIERGGVDFDNDGITTYVYGIDEKEAEQKGKGNIIKYVLNLGRHLML